MLYFHGSPASRLEPTLIGDEAGWQMNWPEALDNLPPVNRPFMNISRRAPSLLPIFLKMMAGSPKDKPAQTLAQFKMSMSAADYAVLEEQPSRVDRLMQMTRDAMAQGTKGAVWDMRLYVRDWDFRLDEIQMHLKLFHGGRDRNVPLAAVRKAMTLLPNAELVVYENEAHLSTLCNHLAELHKYLSIGNNHWHIINYCNWLNRYSVHPIHSWAASHNSYFWAATWKENE